MSVIIKGVDMPKACLWCVFHDDYADYPMCMATGTSVGYTFPTGEKRMDNCPLIEIPTPHGRLIDADEFREVIEALPNCPNGFSDTYDKACIIGLMDEQPTIIEAEVEKDDK